MTLPLIILLAAGFVAIVIVAGALLADEAEPRRPMFGGDQWMREQGDDRKMLKKISDFSHIIGGVLFLAMIFAALAFGSFAAPM